MNYSDLPDPATPWWVWFAVCWGTVFVLWLCFGQKKVGRKRKTKSK